MEIAIGIILIISAVFLIVAVLMQHGKSHNLSGTIAGGAETFFSKSKATTLDRKLSKLTTIVAIVFTFLVLVSYLMQDTTDFSGYIANGGDAVSDTTGTDAGASDAGDTDADDAEDSDAEVSDEGAEVSDAENSGAEDEIAGE